MDRTSMITLHGKWQIRIDPQGEGERNRWFGETFAGQTVDLPGTIDTHKVTEPSKEGNLTGFTPAYPYEGRVWYQREAVIPSALEGKRIELFLERCQWESFVWVGDRFCGSRNSLVGPHLYDLSGELSPGRHRLTVLVDNSNRRSEAKAIRDDMTAHHDLTTEVRGERKLNCGGHHLWSHNWVGILGEMALTARDRVRIDSVNVFPRIEAGEIMIAIALANDAGEKGLVRIEANCSPSKMDTEGSSRATWEIELNGERDQRVERTLKLCNPVRLWDEFEADLYDLTLSIAGEGFSGERRVRFGMRELGKCGSQFTINGRTAFMRGTLENFIFPLTGHPPLDMASWRKILATAKSYGLNLLRFHTCCPPEAAFAAADEIGFYFQVELPGTSCPMADEEPAVEEFLSVELAQILRWYGNHPSLLFVSMGNEQLIVDDPGFLARHGAVLEKKVLYGRRTDGRHLYTSTTHPIHDGDDFHVSSWPAQGSKGQPLCGIQWGGDRVINSSRFNTRAPETASDYREGIAGLDQPLMTHEVGQWSVYPDLREISRYHGAERAFNFEIIRDRLEEAGLQEFAGDFTRASGKLSLLLYKEEIESALRTPGLAGFQLLGLTDYPGQGTSTIGILNALWESKGLVTPAVFRGFCGATVPLARMKKQVWTTGETFEATVDFANYGPKDLEGEATWSLATSDGVSVSSGKLPATCAARGELAWLGTVSAPLADLSAPAKLLLRVEMAGYANAWDLWVYPEAPKQAVPEGVHIATRWDDATRAVLTQGGTVLLATEMEQLRDPVPGTFTTAFWNVQMKNRQVSKTMGLLCDPANPALELFPTEFHANWQWWDIVMRSSAMRMDGLPRALSPIVRVIDSFVENRRLGLVFEARVGKGKLLVCSADITSDLERRPAARQLRESLLAYLTGPLFLPYVQLSEEDLQTIFVEY